MMFNQIEQITFLKFNIHGHSLAVALAKHDEGNTSNLFLSTTKLLIIIVK